MEWKKIKKILSEVWYNTDFRLGVLLSVVFIIDYIYFKGIK